MQEAGEDGQRRRVPETRFQGRDTPNADASRTPDNEHMAATSTDAAMGKLRDRLPEKRRKDAVLCVSTS